MSFQNNLTSPNRPKRTKPNRTLTNELRPATRVSHILRYLLSQFRLYPRLLQIASLLIGLIVAVFVAPQLQRFLPFAYIRSNPHPYGFDAELHSHLTLARDMKSWALASELSVKATEDVFRFEVGVEHQIQRTLEGIHQHLQNNGWIVDSIEEFPQEVHLKSINSEDFVRYDKEHKVLNIDRDRYLALIKLPRLTAHMTQSYPEDSNRWHLSRKRTIPLPLDDHDPALSDQSELLLDAPNGMILGTFPPTKSSDDLIINNYTRMHIPLHFGFDDKPEVALNIAYPTRWANIVHGLTWLVTKGLKWLLAAVATLIGGIVVSNLNKIMEAFRKWRNKEPPKGFGGGAPVTKTKPGTS